MLSRNILLDRPKQGNRLDLGQLSSSFMDHLPRRQLPPRPPESLDAEPLPPNEPVLPKTFVHVRFRQQVQICHLPSRNNSADLDSPEPSVSSSPRHDRPSGKARSVGK